MRTSYSFIALMGIMAACSGSSKTVLAADWPPLNAIETRQSNPVRVGNETFTIGYYSYYVDQYSVDSLHYEKSIHKGPSGWSATVGLGGDEEIGPRFSRRGDAKGNDTKNRSAVLRERGRPDSVESTVPAQQALPALPPLATLPALPALPPPGNLAALPPLPVVPPLAELPSLPPLRENR